MPTATLIFLLLLEYTQLSTISEPSCFAVLPETLALQRASVFPSCMSQLKSFLLGEAWPAQLIGARHSSLAPLCFLMSLFSECPSLPEMIVFIY